MPVPKAICRYDHLSRSSFSRLSFASGSTLAAANIAMILSPFFRLFDIERVLAASNPDPRLFEIEIFPTRLAEKQGQMTSSALTTLRYRCHVECPSMGKTMASPTSKGKDPITRAAATKRPHIAIVIGFASTARTDVRTTVPKPTSRHRSSGSAHHAGRQRHDSEE